MSTLYDVPTPHLMHAKNDGKTLWCGADYEAASNAGHITGSWPQTTCPFCQIVAKQSNYWTYFPKTYVAASGEPEEWDE